jgi:peptide/nickel transport system substrate-binding protein
VQQAKAAGVNVNLRKLDANAYFEGYGEWPFSVDYWDCSDYYQQMALNSLPSSTYNTGKFDDPEFNALYAQGVSELDETKRNAIARKMQEIEFERGAYIVWGFRNLIDGLSTNVTGIPENNVGLSFYSYNFELLHFV